MKEKMNRVDNTHTYTVGPKEFTQYAISFPSYPDRVGGTGIWLILFKGFVHVAQ